jgi:hypothetical protein
MCKHNLHVREIDRYIVDMDRAPYLLRAPGKIDVPV